MDAKQPSLPALREAVAKMTEGPWKAVGIHISPIMETGDWSPSELKTYEDAAGIVALRTAAPALLDELEAARAVLDTAMISGPPDATWRQLLVARAAWLAWQARQT